MDRMNGAVVKNESRPLAASGWGITTSWTWAICQIPMTKIGDKKYSRQHHFRYLRSSRLKIAIYFLVRRCCRLTNSGRHEDLMRSRIPTRWWKRSSCKSSRRSKVGLRLKRKRHAALGVEQLTVATAASVSSIFAMPPVAFNRSKHGNFGEQNMFGHLWHDKYDVQCTMIYFFYVLLCSFR